MSGITFTCAHSRFMAAQILLLFIGFPVRVRKITPLCSPMTCTYWRSSFCNPLGIRMLRVLFLQEMETSPRRTASTVKYCNSDTRIPVAQSVCSSSSHRRRSCFAAFRVGVIRPSSRKALRRKGLIGVAQISGILKENLGSLIGQGFRGFSQ